MLRAAEGGLWLRAQGAMAAAQAAGYPACMPTINAPAASAAPAPTTTAITTLTLDCGMRLVVEPNPSAKSLALAWLLPAGSATDPDDAIGLSTMLSELIFRGAGELDARQHSDALDLLGVQRDGHVLRHHMQLSAMMVGDRMVDALPLLTAMVRQPRLAESTIDPVRKLCLQSLRGLDDEPQHLVGLMVRERHDPPPFNRSGYGEEDVLSAATHAQVRSAWQQRFQPGGSIFAAAGAVDAAQLADQLNALLSDWSGTADEPTFAGEAQRGIWHNQQETAQTHIAMACQAPPEPDGSSMLERLAIGVLSGGTSARLFTEVRQKRSLCYSVGASYRAGRDMGVVRIYAGSRPERAQETVDVIMQECARMQQGATQEEFTRAVTQLKSHLVMSGESTRARAGAIASDLFRLGRARSLDDITATVDHITLDQLNAYLAQRTYGPFTMATIGPTEVQLPGA